AIEYDNLFLGGQMSSGLDLGQFFDTFFDEADELLTEMEGLLLALDVDAPDADDLNAIFRAAHSIKGGAATFGTFEELAETTHVLENVLDDIRNGELPLRADMIDLFLTTKDVLSDMVSAYRQSEPLDPDVSLSLRENLVNVKKEPASSAQNRPSITQSEHLKIHIESIRPQDATALRSEMAIMGEVLHEEAKDDSITFWLDTATAVDDIIAVSCFVVNEEQITTAYASLPGPAQENQTKSEIAQPNRTKTQTGSARRSESSTLRVGVKRVDQIINLVGELVITQAMLVQTAEDLDPVVHDRLLNGLEQLERNARDLQEAVMAIRMVPMDYVFNRFPRVVRENAQRLGKNIRLVTKGQATELDKSLIERIIDPLTHLVRNCID